MIGTFVALFLLLALSISPICFFARIVAACFSREARQRIAAHPVRHAIWALTTLLLIPIIGSFFTPISHVGEQAKKVAAHNDETQIVAAINAYYTEYGKYPMPPSTSGSPHDTYYGSAPIPPHGAAACTNDLLFDILRNNTGNPANAAIVAAMNPRGIAFLDIPEARDNDHPLAGVIPNNANPSLSQLKPGTWVDPWGTPYNILIGTSGARKLANPYADAPGGAPLPTGVIVWSFGKNGALGGGPAAGGDYSSEPGTPGNFLGSGDVISWE